MATDSYLPYQDPVTTSRKLDSDSLTVGANTVERERVRIAGEGATHLAEVAAGTPASGSFGIIVRNIPSGSQQVIGALVISNIVGGTLNTVASVSNVVTGSIQLDPLSHVTVQNLKQGTLTTVSSVTTGSIQLDPLSHVTVQNIKGGTVTTVASVTNVVGGSIQLDPNSAIAVVKNINGGTLTTVASVTNVVAGSIQTIPGSQVVVSNIAGGTITSLTNGSVQLLAGSQLIGTVQVVPTLMYSVTGATTGAGTTYIQGAVASKKIKVYAYDIITTVAATYFEVKFTDGLAGGGVLACHGLVNATGNCVAGIAKSVTPPAYLFATTVGNTLTLMSSAAQPINYNVSYWISDAV